MDEITLQGTDLNVNGYKISLLDIDFIIFDKGINIYKSNGKILNLKINLNHFLELGRMFNDAGIEQFAYLKGNRIVNVENINKVLWSNNGIQVITGKHNIKMNGLGESEARMLASMHLNSTFISDYNLIKSQNEIYK